jgi:hypothetical protein
VKLNKGDRRATRARSLASPGRACERGNTRQDETSGAVGREVLRGGSIFFAVDDSLIVNVTVGC